MKAEVGGDAALLLYAAHHHAHVPGFDDDGDAEGVEGLVDRLEDLIGQPLLYLEARLKTSITRGILLRPTM